MQTKKLSLIESLIQTFIGLSVSFIIQLIIYPVMDIEVSYKQNIIITLVFTIASIIRGYFVRRLFNRMK